MGKLHELLAVEPDLTGQANKVLAETLHVFSKGEFVQGMKKKHEVIVEGEDDFEPEAKEMVTTVPDRLKYTLESQARLIDASVSKEVTNTEAAADIIIDGAVVINLPATALLNLENKFKALREVVEKAPTLDAATKWIPEATQKNVFRSPEETKYRTRKIEDYRVIVPPTDKHPAQIAQTTVDRRVGKWITVYFSGAISSVQKSKWLAGLDKVLMAVKQARQRANCAEVKETKVAQLLFAKAFGDLG